MTGEHELVFVVSFLLGAVGLMMAIVAVAA